MTPEDVVAIVAGWSGVLMWQVEMCGDEVVHFSIDRAGATPWWRRNGYESKEEFELERGRRSGQAVGRGRPRRDLTDNPYWPAP